MSDTTAIIMSIVGTGIGTIGIMGLMVRMLATNVTARIADLRTDMNRRLDDAGNGLQTLANRLDETNRRIDAIGRDIADRRDRTGTLEGTLSTFMVAGKSPNAA